MNIHSNLFSRSWRLISFKILDLFEHQFSGKLKELLSRVFDLNFLLCGEIYMEMEFVVSIIEVFEVNGLHSIISI